MSTSQSRRQQLEALLADDPTDPFLHYGLAMEYVSAGDDVGAVPRFERLLEVAPHYVPGYVQAGLTLSRLERAAEARAVWQRGVGVATQQGDLHAAGEMEGMLAGLD